MAAIECFSSSRTFLQKLEQGELYAIYFLDIDMPGMDGIQLGEMIRQKSGGSTAAIVFISNRQEKVFSAFRITPLRFVRKQCFTAEIQEAVKAAIDFLEKSSCSMLSFLTTNGVLTLPSIQVLYLETNNKIQHLVATGQTYEISSTLDSLEQDLQPRGFLRTHRCYLINYEHIFLIKTDTVLLDNQAELPLSKRRRSAVREAYIRRCM